MSKWFLFSVLILAVSFAVIYFMIGNDPAPGLAPGCTNRYDTETACYNLKVCRRVAGTTVDYAPADDSGNCPTGFSTFTINTQNMDSLCAIAKAMSAHNAANDPPQCATGCYDRGVSKYEDRNSQTLCCTAGAERTCTDSPQQKQN